MNLRSRPFRTFSILLFAAGAVIGLALAGVAIWGDLEATLFDPSIAGETRLRTLRCPVVMTEEETGIVSARFTNITERPIDLLVRTRISHRFVTLRREENKRLLLEPGETGELEWAVTAEDMAFRRFVLVRVYSFRQSPMPSRWASCGIMVVNAPGITGNQIVALALAAGLIGMGAGAGLWFAGNRPLSKRPREVMGAMIAMGITVLGAILTGLAGWWLVGLLFFALTILIMGAIFERFVLP